MQVFISWSGPQSNAVAKALREWLTLVLPDKITPFVSSDDIVKGSRGLTVIKKQLEESSFGIVVVTPSNLESTWIHFEAGALARAMEDEDRVAPLLVGVEIGDVDGPLRQYQQSMASDKQAVFQLVQSINASHAEPMNNTAVTQLFELNWPTFEGKLQEALLLDDTKPPRRDTGEMLEEVLTTVRALQREVGQLRARIEPGKLPRRNDLRLGGDRHGDAMTRALQILIDSDPTNREQLTASNIGRTVIVSMSDAMPDPGPQAMDDFHRLAHETRFSIRLQRESGTWFEIDPDGLNSAGVGGPLGFA
jgi:hypothetical protein